MSGTWDGRPLSPYNDTADQNRDCYNTSVHHTTHGHGGSYSPQESAAARILQQQQQQPQRPQQQAEQAQHTYDGRRRAGFLDLPAELRIKVYEYLLDDLLKASRTFRGSRIAMMRSQSSLPHACRQIRFELNHHFRTRYLGLKL